MEPVWPKCSTPSGRDAMAVDRAEPGQRRRMAVEHRDDAAIGGQAGEQPLDVRAGVNEAALPRAQCRRPAGVEPIG